LPGISYGNSERIGAGMSVSEVEAILGGPGKLGPEYWGDQGPGEPQGCEDCNKKVRIWQNTQERIIVRFDDQLRVTRKIYYGPPQGGGYLDFFRRILPW